MAESGVPGEPLLSLRPEGTLPGGRSAGAGNGSGTVWHGVLSCGPGSHEGKP